MNVWSVLSWASCRASLRRVASPGRRVSAPTAPCDFRRKASPRVAPANSGSHERPFRVCSSTPQVRSAHARMRPGTNPILTRSRELDAWPLVRQVLAPTVGPRTHDPPTCPVDRTGGTSPSGSDPACGTLSRSARPPIASPARVAAEGATPPNPNRTCCPRPLSAAPRASRALRPNTAREGRHSVGPQRRSFSVCQWDHPSSGGPTLLGFCPSSNKLPSASYGGVRLRRPSTLRPTGGSPRGGRSVTGTTLGPS